MATMHTLTATDGCFAVKSIADPTQSLILSRDVSPTGDIHVTVGAFDHAIAATHKFNIWAIYGVFPMLHGPYLAVVTDATFLGRGPGHSRFYRVDKVELLPFRSSAPARAVAKEDRWLCDMLQSIWARKAFYFAEQYDICLTAQAAAVAGKSRPLWERADPRFFWNASALQPIIRAGCAEFITPMIMGMVKILPSLPVRGSRCDLVFISRRSCRRVGTRFNVRGLDKHGNAANYTETEQLILHEDGSLSAHTQVRGSVPLFWTQAATLKFVPRVVIGGTQHAAQLALAKHAEEQVQHYGRVVCVNLIEEHGDQGLLGRTFKRAVDFLARPDFKMVWFDFHKECRKMQWHHLKKLVDMVDDAFTDAGYFHQRPDGSVERQQSGIIRTNCMDNLDRTNVVQSLFARRAVLWVTGNKDAQTDVLSSPFSEFEHVFKNAWADHADVISYLYAGSGALKTDFTRTGVRTLAGVMHDAQESSKRFLLNNFVDGHTQDCWDLFVGRYCPDPSDRVKIHLSRARPGVAGLLKNLLLVLASIIALVAAVCPADMTWQSGIVVGLMVSLLCMVVVAFCQLKLGIGIGHYIVSKPILRPPWQN